MKHLICSLLGISFNSMISGCLSPMTCNRVIVAYDEAVVSAEAKQLLIGIARVQHHQPFTSLGYQILLLPFIFYVNAGVTPALTRDLGTGCCHS
jgi:hypothetical protein